MSIMGSYGVFLAFIAVLLVFSGVVAAVSYTGTYNYHAYVDKLDQMQLDQLCDNDKFVLMSHSSNESYCPKCLLNCSRVTLLDFDISNEFVWSDLEQK